MPILAKICPNRWADIMEYHDPSLGKMILISPYKTQSVMYGQEANEQISQQPGLVI